MIEVELLQRLSGREAGRMDAASLPWDSGRELSLQTGHLELLMSPRLGAGPLGQPGWPLRGLELTQRGDEARGWNHGGSAFCTA
jgi:hypothetical protein